MAIPIPLLLAGAGILSSLLKSQEYYPAAEAPTQTQVWGDVLGSGLGGYLGGSILGPLGGGQAGAPAAADPTAGAGAPLTAGGGVSEQDRAMLDFLTGGGITGAGVPGGVGGGLNSILALLGQQATTPAAARAPETLVPGGILSGVR